MEFIFTLMLHSRLAAQYGIDSSRKWATVPDSR